MATANIYLHADMEEKERSEQSRRRINRRYVIVRVDYRAVRQDASGVHEAAMCAIAAVTRETPDTPAAAALAWRPCCVLKAGPGLQVEVLSG